VPLVRSVAIRQLKWSGIREGVQALQPLDFGNSFLKVHPYPNYWVRRGEESFRSGASKGNAV
jgi:hypothetical protein